MATARRLRGVIAAAIFIIFGVLFLYTQHSDEYALSEASSLLKKPFGKAHTPADNEDTSQEQTQEQSNHIDTSIKLPQPTVETTPEGVISQPSLPEAQTPETAIASPKDIAPELPLPGDEKSPEQNLNVEEQEFKAEFLFQEDLKVDLPVATFKTYANFKPHNYVPNTPTAPKLNAYATFMATRNPSIKDPYYLAIHSLIYRVLWSARSRTERYPFIVFVGDFVTAEQRELLTGAGAIVRELAPLEWQCDKPGWQPRWKDLFAKLNMWKETEFSRILFLDADAFPVAPIDEMFGISPVQECKQDFLEEDDRLADGTPVCEPYVFAGVPQNPLNATHKNVNVGSMVFEPSERMHLRLLQNYRKTDRYDCAMAEQAFLNWQFGVNSAFPATLLEREWGGFFPSAEEDGKLKVVHEKIWVEDDPNLAPWLKQEWVLQWQNMLAFYNSNEFVEARKRDGPLV
jgi:hypothetical protein